MPGAALLFEAVAVSLDLNDVSVMQDAVEHGGRQRGVAAEGGVPLRERQVARQDHRATLVALGDDLEEVAGLVAGQRQIADLVDDEQAGSQDVVPQNRVVPLLAPGRLQLQHQVSGCDELRLDPSLGGGVAQRDGQMRLAHTGWAQQHSVLALVDEP